MDSAECTDTASGEVTRSDENFEEVKEISNEEVKKKHSKRGKSNFTHRKSGRRGRASFTPIESSVVENVHSSEPLELSLQAQPGLDGQLRDDAQVDQASQSSQTPDSSVIDLVVSEVKRQLPFPWICIGESDGLNVLLLSRDRERSVQRRVFFSYSGEIQVTVHRKPILGPLLGDILLQKKCSRVVLSKDNSSVFIKYIVSVVNKFRSFEVCVGVDEDDFQIMWTIDKSGEVDRNPYGELRYRQTFRPFQCQLLVPTTQYLKRRCHFCIQTKMRFSGKIKSHQNDSALPNTPNIHLDKDQMLHKLSKQAGHLKYARAQVAKLKSQLQSAISEDGVLIDDDFSDDLSHVFNGAKLTPFQELFIEEQPKAARAKSASGRRWHPSLIRFALLLKTTSSAAYQTVRDSGVIILPSERTLFEYSHAVTPEVGCTSEKLERVCKMLTEKYPKPYQKFHVLAMDEMHINKKLVYQKSTEEMVGYIDLSDAELALKDLEAELKGEKGPDSMPMASKMLTFQVNGVANGISEVIATYPTTDNLNSTGLYRKVWSVIAACERSGIQIVGVVSDGAATNRAFYSSNPPFTKSTSVVFDTVNLADPSRVIYFFSDVPHLLKTIRNCFYKSGSGQGSTRLLTKNKQVIVWETIRKLFKEEKENILRRSYKLNVNNVYLNSYSVMKVTYAAQVLSRTVDLDLESKNWPGTSETVNFIRRVNDFFDSLNGASTAHGKRTANENLDPYVDNERLGERFDQLLGFLDYLNEWKTEVEAKAAFSKTEKKKMLLSQQTIQGVEITIRSFIGATRFLLKEAGVKFINARVFCQDPLEKYFDKQRQSGGGNRNPTVAQFIGNEVKLAVHRDTNVRKGNVSSEVRGLEVTDEPLPKRSRPVN